MEEAQLLATATLLPAAALAVVAAWNVRLRMADRTLAANVATLFSSRMEDDGVVTDPGTVRTSYLRMLSNPLKGVGLD